MDDLRAVVAAATEAPWKYDGEDAGYHTVYAPNAFVVADCADNADADARYIATFDPSLVSRLLDVVEAAREFVSPPPADVRSDSAEWYVRRERALRRAVAALDDVE